MGAKTADIMPVARGKTAIASAFNSKLRDELHTQWRNLLHDQGGKNAHRKLATSLQYRAAALIAVPQATGTPNDYLASPERTNLNTSRGQIPATIDFPTLNNVLLSVPSFFSQRPEFRTLVAAE